MPHQKTIPKILQRLINFWAKITRPLVPFADENAAIEAQLITSLILGSFVIGALIVIMRIISYGQSLLLGAFNLAFVLVAYLAVRRGYYIGVLKIIVVVISLSLFVSTALLVNSQQALANLYYLSVLLVLVSGFLSVRFIVLVLVLHSSLLLILPQFVNTLDPAIVNNGPLVFNILLTVLTLLMAVHRQYLERNRQQPLEESEAHYRMITGISTDYAFKSRVEPDGRVIPDWVTDTFEQATGYKLDELSDRYQDSILYSAEDWAHIMAQMEECRQTRKPVSGEYQMITKGGDKRWVRLHRRPIWSEEEQRVVAFYGVVQDIQERKLAEIALKESEERYKILTELISDYAFSYGIEADGTPVHAWLTEDSFFRVTGLTLDQLKIDGQNLFHPEDWPRMRADMARVVTGETISNDYRIITQKGEIRWLHFHRRPVWDAAENRVTRVYGIAQDITQQREAEIELQESEERYRRMVEFSPEGIIIHHQGLIRFVNVAGGKLLGTEHPEELIGRSLFEFIHPDYQDLAHERLQQVQVARQPVSFVEQKFIQLDGTVIVVEVAGVPIIYQHEPCVHMVFKDISERKQAEAQALEMALEQERLEFIGRFVSALSHDFRTSLANIETSRYLIERKAAPDKRDQLLPHVTTINNSISRMADQLNNLQSIFALASINLTSTDVNQLVDIAIAAHKPLAIQRNVSLAFEPNQSLPYTMLDTTHITNALKHLLSNAINFTPARGTVRVLLEHDLYDLHIVVQDTGIGIEENYIPFIYDLFYRVDPARGISSGGVGVGLSIVKMVAEAHGGRIQVASTPGSGSTFRLSIPLVVEVE